MRTYDKTFQFSSHRNRKILVQQLLPTQALCIFFCYKFIIKRTSKKNSIWFNIMSDHNTPKIKTLQSWKSEFSLLTFNVNIGLQCNVCKKWKEKIMSVENFSDTFIKGSTNYQKWTIADHAKTAQHLKSLEL